MAAYLADLRRLAEHCNYGDTLDKMLRDRLVWGVNDAGIQRKLLQENDPLTLARALTVAMGAETADKNLKEMKAPPEELNSSCSSQAGVKVKSEPVQRIHTKKKVNMQLHPGHLATTCKFKDKVCHKCKKRGHIARVCRSKPPPSSPGTKPRRPIAQPVRQVGEEQDYDSEESMEPIYTLEQGRETLDYPPLRYILRLIVVVYLWRLTLEPPCLSCVRTCSTSCGLGGA